MSKSGAGVIAFERTVGREPTEIYVMDTDGSGVRKIVRGCCHDWSPDGRRLAFVDDAGIYVINVDGTGLTPVVITPDHKDATWWVPTVPSASN